MAMSIGELLFEAAYGKNSYDEPEAYSSDDCNDKLALASFKKLSEREQEEALSLCLGKWLAWRKSNVKSAAKTKAFTAAKSNHALLESLVTSGFYDMAVLMYSRSAVNQELLKQGKPPLPEPGK